MTDQYIQTLADYHNFCRTQMQEIESRLAELGYGIIQAEDGRSVTYPLAMQEPKFYKTHCTKCKKEMGTSGQCEQCREEIGRIKKVSGW